MYIVLTNREALLFVEFIECRNRIKKYKNKMCLLFKSLFIYQILVNFRFYKVMSSHIKGNKSKHIFKMIEF